MRKNERLIGIRPYQTSTGDWHFELTYGYEDKKGEHRVIFPDVQCVLLSYANGTHAKDQIGAYPMLVQNALNVVTTIPKGLEGRVVRTACPRQDRDLDERWNCQ